MKKIQLLLLTLFWTALTLGVNAQKVEGNTVKTDPKILEDFMSKRFGMFIHWGPVSLRGTEIGWSRVRQVPMEEYDNLYKEFNPVLFNADEWVKVAKDAGMKYITITSKHHDGFCLWPSAYTDYDIMSSPYKKDIVGALAKACKKQGIKFCIYFTILDWHDKNYPIHNDGKGLYPDGNMDAFRMTIKNQLKELITKYDPYMLWFDGQWEEPWTDAMGVDLYAYLKGLKKDLIINNRLGKEMSGTKNTNVDYSKMVGDYDTPEQKIGNINMDFPWESCITICNQWAWKPNDKMKTLKECLQTLVKTASGNGNLLFNVGPMLDGRMEQRQIDRLKEMGNWLKKYGESVYNTKGGPYKPNNIYATTRKGNQIFVHIFKTDTNEIKLPPIPNVQIKKAYFMKGDPLSIKQDETGILLKFPAKMPDENDTVVVLDINQDAETIPLVIENNKKGLD